MAIDRTATEDADIYTAARLLGVDPADLLGGVGLATAAKLLGIGLSTLRQRALAGKIACQRDGRRWIFSACDLGNYVLSRRVAAGADGRSGGPHQLADRAGAPAHATKSVEDEAKEFGLL